MASQHSSGIGIGRYVLLGTAIAALILGAFSLYKTSSVPRIAFIRTRDLVYQYAGMQEAQNRFKSKQAAWQQEIDSLELEFNRQLDTLNVRAASYSSDQLEHRKRELALQQTSLEERRKNLEEMASKEDTELTEGVLNQINSFIEKYGQEHGYDIVIGTTATGNVLYGAPALDITQDILNQLNKSHVVKEN